MYTLLRNSPTPSSEQLNTVFEGEPELDHCQGLEPVRREPDWTCMTNPIKRNGIVKLKLLLFCLLKINIRKSQKHDCKYSQFVPSSVYRWCLKQGWHVAGVSNTSGASLFLLFGNQQGCTLVQSKKSYIYKTLCESRTVGVENNVAGRLKVDVFLECAQC